MSKRLSIEKPETPDAVALAELDPNLQQPDELDEYLANVHDRPAEPEQPLPLHDWTPARFNGESRGPLPGDLFKVLHPGAYSLKDFRANLQKAKDTRDTFTRGELICAGLGLANLVREGVLQPQSDGCPEQRGISPAELAEEFASRHKADAARKAAAAFELLRGWEGHPVKRMSDGSADNLFREAIAAQLKATPAALLPVLQELQRQDWRTRELCQQLLLQDPQAWTGKAAAPALPVCVAVAADNSHDIETRKAALAVAAGIPAPVDRSAFVVIWELSHGPDPDLRTAAAELIFSRWFSA